MAGLFFVVGKQVLLHRCSLEKAESYGDFLIYPRSHMQVWDKHYSDKYPVDFDYYPRGRIVYHTKEDTYYIYYDRCLEDSIRTIPLVPEDTRVKYLLDFHYQCHQCNPDYAQ